MKRALFLALCVVPFASCGEPDIEPASGMWSFTSAQPSKDTCGGEASINSGTFLLTNHGDGTFTVDPQDGSEVFECTLDGEAFSCPRRLQESVSQAGVDAKIDINVSASGTFSSATAASGAQDATVECAGGQCGLAAAALGITFPCEISASFTATFKG